MKTLVVANQKGGVGKSALATQFAFYAVSTGRRVLFIDLENQGNSSNAILRSQTCAAASFTSYDLLLSHAAHVPDSNFVLIPGDDRLAYVDSEQNHNSVVNALNNFLVDHYDTFDVCVIDTGPNPDIRYAIALITGDYLVAPIQLTQEAVEGVKSLLGHPRYGLRKIKSSINPELVFLGILPNMVKPTPFHRDNLKVLAEAFPQYFIAIQDEPLKLAFIPERIVIAKAQAAGQFLGTSKIAGAKEAWAEIEPIFANFVNRMDL